MLLFNPETLPENVTGNDFNTSNVTIQPREERRNKSWDYNFNTSNVTIQHIR